MPPMPHMGDQADHGDTETQRENMGWSCIVLLERMFVETRTLTLPLFLG